MLLKLQPSLRRLRKRPMELVGRQPAWQTEWADASTILSAAVLTDGKKSKASHVCERRRLKSSPRSRDWHRIGVRSQCRDIMSGC